MKDTIILILIALLVAGLAGLIGYKLLTKGGGENNTLPGGDQRTFFHLDKGKISPNGINLQANLTNLIVVTNRSSEKHELVLVRVSQSGARMSEEILRTITLESMQTENIRIRLTPGDYLIYCTLKKGEREHRKDGEETKIIVH